VGEVLFSSPSAERRRRIKVGEDTGGGGLRRERIDDYRY